MTEMMLGPSYILMELTPLKFLSETLLESFGFAN